MVDRKLKIYFVLGENSGDALGADLMAALNERASKQNLSLDVVGLAGPRLSKLGVQSLFDIEDIAVMGLSAVLARLPLIIRRIYQTVSDIVEQKPDMIVLIDSPDFTHAVAKRVRKRLPDVPVIGYVCPSVWAWRPSRAVKMKAYVDHILAILPFEPDALKRLGGPSATYVGHPIAQKIAALPKRPKADADKPPILLVLPGSRNSEIDKMLARYGDTLEILRDRDVEFHAVLPAIARLKDKISTEIADWAVKPEIVDAVENDQTFAKAHAALATSGTVTLELALHKVPMVTAYRLDRVARLFGHLITVWTSILPNLIVDRLIVPEEHNETVIPNRLARSLVLLLTDTPQLKNQLDVFDEVIGRMKTKRPPSELAAEIVLDHIRQ